MLKNLAIALAAMLVLTSCGKRHKGGLDGSLSLNSNSEATIYFDYDSSDIKEESKALLTKVADMLKANPSMKIVIEGHCDERGTREYNLALGEKRGVAGKKFLSKLGIQGDRMKVISYGKDRPVVSGIDEGTHALNRRDEIRKDTGAAE